MKLYLPEHLPTEMPLRWERLVEQFYGQDRRVAKVSLRAISPGRSGAHVFFASPQTTGTGPGAQLQGEFLKIGSQDLIEREVEQFNQLVAGFQIVYGQVLSREPLFQNGLGAFSLPLFEAGAEVAPFWAKALGDPNTSLTTMSDFCQRITEWYGASESVSGPIRLPIKNKRLEEGLSTFASFLPSVGSRCRDALKALTDSSRSTALTRAHGDLHLENILVDKAGHRPYLIDFGLASPSGQACMDLARLESDLLYRLLPLDLNEDAIAKAERSLWTPGEIRPDRSRVSLALINELRAGTSEIRQSPNSILCWLAGRIINGLRMLSGSWTTLFPFNLPERRAGIAASVGALTGLLERALEGEPVEPKVWERERFPLPITSESCISRSLASLYISRQNRGAHDLAVGVARAIPKTHSIINFFGLLTGMYLPCPTGQQPQLTVPSRPVTKYERGLRSLYRAAVFLSPDHRNPRKAIKELESAVLLFSTSNNRHFKAIALDQLARLKQNLGEIEAAKILFDESIQVKKQLGDEVGLALSYGGLALLHLSTFQYDPAEKLLRKNLSIAEQQEDSLALSKIENWLGQVELEGARNLVEARRHFLKSLNYAGDNLVSRGYAYLGLGFTSIRSHAVRMAIEQEQMARELYEQSEGILGRDGIHLTEVLSGEVLLLKGAPKTGILRIKNGLNQLRQESRLLLLLDYGVRSCTFLRSLGYLKECAAIASDLKTTAEKMNTSYEVVQSLRQLAETHATTPPQ